MGKNKKKCDNLIPIYKAARLLGIKTEVIRYQIEAGKIEAIDQMVDESIFNKIKKQQEMILKDLIRNMPKIAISTLIFLKTMHTLALKR